MIGVVVTGSFATFESPPEAAPVEVAGELLSAGPPVACVTGVDSEAPEEETDAEPELVAVAAS